MKKTNNKGFSLVELIIVIAIMAILVGVLAPQYIKYVERSRKSADEDVADSLLKAVTTSCSDEDYAMGIDDGNNATFSKTGISVTGDTLKAALDEYFSDYETKKVKSKTYKDKTYTVSVTVNSNVAKCSGTWGN